MRLAHLSLAVVDQERSRRLYKTFFGFTCDGKPKSEGCLISRMRTAAVTIALTRRSGEASGPTEARRPRPGLLASES